MPFLNDSKTDSHLPKGLETGRLWRFIGGLILLALIGTPVAVISTEANVMNWVLALAIYLIYLIIQALLMVWLFGILFQQHEMRKFKIGIGAMLILTAMIALPMGTASFYRSQEKPPTPQVAEQVPGMPLDTDAPNRDELAMINVYFIILMYVSLFPLLVVLEAVMAWYLAIRQRQSRRVAG